MRTILALFAALAVVAAGCGGGNDEAGTAPTPLVALTPEVESTPASTEPPAAAPSVQPTAAPTVSGSPEATEVPTLDPAEEVNCPGPAYDIDGDGEADECVPTDETPVPTADPTVAAEVPEEAVCDPGATAADTDGDGVLDECLVDFAFTPKPTSEGDEIPATGATPVAVVCNPETIHGVWHEMVPTDTDGDGVADECRELHTHPHAETLVEADWYNDPSCRNALRWWDGHAWSETVSSSGAGLVDPLQEGESFPPPEAGLVPDCPTEGAEDPETEPADTPTGYTPGDTGPGWSVNSQGRVILSRLLTPDEGIEAYVAAHLHDVVSGRRREARHRRPLHRQRRQRRVRRRRRRPVHRHRVGLGGGCVLGGDLHLEHRRGVLRAQRHLEPAVVAVGVVQRVVRTVQHRRQTHSSSRDGCLDHASTRTNAAPADTAAAAAYLPPNGTRSNAGQTVGANGHTETPRTVASPELQML